MPDLSFYRELGFLGRGAFGEVWLAEDRRTNRKVAIKKLVRITDEAKAQFRREVKILHDQINNRFVVDVLNFNLDAPQPFVVLEYCEGGSLRSQIGDPMFWSVAVGWLTHLVNGLHGIHRNGGFHRDLKPENILVARDVLPDGKETWIAKISDFGLGRIPFASTLMTQSPHGTPAYMAPEILREDPYTQKADIYSLGLVGIEMVTGRRDPGGLRGVMIPRTLKVLLARMVDPRPERRPDTREIAASLDNLWRQPEHRAHPKLEHPPQDSLLGKLALGGIGLVLLKELLHGEGTWDRHVQRYRGENGRFQSP